ncbi:MAG: hypothetical protein KDC54_00155, partial [Lewinella sp.]|nr:hypothetical protein [Lewinella sp.]
MWRCFLLIGLFQWVGWSLPLAAQQWANAPAVAAGPVRMLDNPNDPLQPCIGDLIQDASGRLWFSVCGTYAVEYQMPLLQFDGYRLTQQDLGGIDLAGRSITTLVDRPNQAGAWGFLNGRGQSLIFHVTGTAAGARVYPTPFDNIRNLVVDERGNFWLGVINKSTLSLHHWWPDSCCVAAAEVSWDTTTPGQVKPDQYPDRFFLDQARGSVWLAFSSGPVYRYTPSTQQMDTLRVNDRGWQVNRQPNPTSWVLPSGDSTLVLLPDRLPGLFVLRPGQNQLDPHPAVPANWRCLRMTRDQHGRIAFLFEQPDRQLRLLVMDQAGLVLDLTDLIKDFRRIFSLRSDDFFRHLFAATQQGAFFVAVRETDGLSRYGSGSMRWMVELEDGSIWGFTQQRAHWMFRHGNFVENPAVVNELLNNILSTRSSGQIISAPDGRSWMLWEKQLLELDPYKAELELHPLGVPLQRGIFTDANTLIFVEGESRRLYRFQLAERQLEAVAFPGL